MLVSGGKILALSEVKKDNTLAGNGTPNSPLGVSESYTTSAQDWVRNYVSAVAGDTIPYSGVGPIKIEEHKVSFNSAGFASESWVKAQKYAPSAWADNRYAKKTDLEPYALKDDVYTKQQADNTFIPRTASGNWDIQEYSAGDGIGISNHKISVTADYILRSYLENNYYSKTEVDDKLASLGGYKVVNGDPDTHEPIYSGDDKSKWIFLTEDPAASGNDKYFEWIWLNDAWKCIGETSMDLDGYATDEELQTAIDNLSATYLKKEDFHDTTYTEGANIHIYGNDNTISGRDWTPELTTIQDDVDKKLYTSAFNNWSAHAFDGYATETWVNEQGFLKADALEPYATTEWVNSNFSGKDALAEEFAKYYTKNEADETFVPVDTFNSYSAGIDEDLRNISASLDDKMDKTASANWDLDNYSGKDGIKIENHWISVSAQYVTPEALQTELEGYYTKEETSGKQALAEEFAKYQLAGEYITSADADEKYIPKTWSADKDITPYSGGEGIKVENHIISLSAVPQNIEITSHDESVNVSSATDPQTGITTYDLTVPPPAAEVNISGENGVSAQYDEATSAWLIGLVQANSATYMGTQSTQTTLTADATPANPETLSGFGINTRIYGHDIVVTTDTVTLEKGMYHVDLQIDVTVPGTDPAYYTTTIKPTLSNSVLTHVIDGSYAHTETLDLSFIIDVATATSSSALQFELEGLPAGASYIVKNLQVCEIVTVDSVLNAQGGTYTGGDAIAIDAQNQINVKYDSASGLGLNANGQLVVKLGKGLKFDDTEGAVEGTLVLDDVTEEVVEVVKDLEVELEGKLTVNMNVSDAKNVGSPFYGGSTPCLGAALFTVPLNHKLNTDSEISFFTSQAMNQSNSFPIMVGILEYDFAYMDPDVGKRARTKWIGDTGLIWSDTPAVDGNTIGDSASNANRKYTFKLKNLTPVIEEEVTVGGVKYINKVGPELRSDRAYYLVMFSRAPQGLDYFLSDQGYATPTHSNPLLSFYCDNMNYYEYEGAEAQAMSQWSDNTWSSHANDLAMSAINFWNRGGEANSIYRPFVMIRNNV
jgi:hypothetical protein